jgi:IS30 family transposase
VEALYKAGHNQTMIANVLTVHKSKIVDWEGDTIIGKGHQGVVTTHIERKTKYTVLTKSNTPNQCAKASYKD